MMDSLSDTQRINAFPERQRKRKSGPGCLIWGIFAVSGILLAIIIVGFATFSGWNEGIEIAKSNATNVQAATISAQCDWIARDIESNTTNLLQRRFDELSAQNPVPSCVALHAPTATALYLANLPTETPQLTATPDEILIPSPTENGQPVIIQATTAPPVAQPNSNNGYNLDGLLEEAQELITAAEWLDAIDTLEAIIAVDPNYQEQMVKDLMLQALTSYATRLYRAGDNGQLAEAILLTDRAEKYGDIGDLGFERFIASTFLEAQRLAGNNYPEAIRLLRVIVTEQGLVNYRNGAATNLLFNQYVTYGDALGFGGSHCNAVNQYNAALAIRSDSGVQAKANTAQVLCNQGATPQPGGIAPSGPQPTYAPVGQPGS